MSINSAAADLLESAAFVIGTGHHAKGDYARNANGKVMMHFEYDACCWCAIGAIWSAEDALDTGKEAIDVAADALIGEIGAIPIWNDAPERTPEEVEAAMLKAAAKLRSEA